MNQVRKYKTFINTVSKPLSRRCSSCGNSYFRRNRIEVWTGRNPGKRLGWHKDIASVCLKCQDVEESSRIIGIADVQFKKNEVARRKA